MGALGMSSARRTVGLIGVGAMAVLLAACSSGSSGSAKAGGSSTTTGQSGAGSSGGSTASTKAGAGACSLLTSDQVATVMHESFSPGKQSSAIASNDNCVFNGSGGPSDIVGIDVVSGANATGLMSSGRSLPNMTQVSGVGTSAYLESDGRALVAQQGSVAVEVTITGFSQLDAPTLSADAKAIAVLVLTHG